MCLCVCNCVCMYVCAYVCAYVCMCVMCLRHTACVHYVIHTDSFSGHLTPWSLTLHWYGKPFVFFIMNSLEKLCVTTSSGQHQLRMAGLRLGSGMYMCVRVCVRVCV